MNARKIAALEIIKAHDLLGNPLSEDDRNLLNGFDLIRLSQELMLLKETLEVRLQSEYLKMTLELKERQKAQAPASVNVLN